MAIFGKYMLRVECKNGYSGFYMGVMDGMVTLTDNTEAAHRFITESGARAHIITISDMNVFTDEARLSTIDGVFVVKAKNW